MPADVRQTAKSLARRVPRLASVLDDRARWQQEAMRRRAKGAALQQRLDTAVGEAAAAAGQAAAAQAELAAARERQRALEAEVAAESTRYARLRKDVGYWLPGNCYSPIPDLHEVRARDDELWQVAPSVPGIDFRPAAQLALLPALAEAYRDCPFPDDPTPEFRYAFHNRFFAHPDGLVYHGLLRTWQPRRILEVGSGWSSALLLDTLQRFGTEPVELTFIDPYPERLESLLREEDLATTTIIREPLWKVGGEVFDVLGPGDVLFIDSTHVARIGSDVNRLLLDVLPTLPAGVHVHLHDVFYPFEYPRGWVYEGRAWNEAYLLRALLTDNPTLQVTWSNSYLRAFHAEEVTAAMPRWALGHGGSFWLETLPGPTRRS